MKKHQKFSSDQATAAQANVLNNATTVAKKHALHTHTCCICGKKFKGYGNNPFPVVNNGRCCDKCNSNVVIPAKMQFGKKSDDSQFSGLNENDVVKVTVYPARDVLNIQELLDCYSRPSSAYNSCFNTLVRKGTTYVEGYIPFGNGRLLMPFAVNKTSDGRYFDTSLEQDEPFEFFVKREYSKEEIFHIHGTARMSYLTIGNEPKYLQPSSNK